MLTAAFLSVSPCAAEIGAVRQKSCFGTRRNSLGHSLLPDDGEIKHLLSDCPSATGLGLHRMHKPSDSQIKTPQNTLQCGIYWNLKCCNLKSRSI